MKSLTDSECQRLVISPVHPGLQQEQIVHGPLESSRFLLLQAVDDVIAILRPEVKPLANASKMLCQCKKGAGVKLLF